MHQTNRNMLKLMNIDIDRTVIRYIPQALNIGRNDLIYFEWNRIANGNLSILQIVSQYLFIYLRKQIVTNAWDVSICRHIKLLPAHMKYELMKMNSSLFVFYYYYFFASSFGVSANALAAYANIITFAFTKYIEHGMLNTEQTLLSFSQPTWYHDTVNVLDRQQCNKYSLLELKFARKTQRFL